MSLSASLHSYPAEIDAFDKALASERGIRIPFSAHHRARRFINRLHHVRKVQRNENTRALGADHPLAGHSDWDTLICSIESSDEESDGVVWVKIEKAPVEMMGIEPL